MFDEIFYRQAYYALILRAKLQKNETIYVHAGISGLCVACLNVALGVEAKPFIGYNNQIEKNYLRDTFQSVSYILTFLYNRRPNIILIVTSFRLVRFHQKATGFKFRESRRRKPRTSLI